MQVSLPAACGPGTAFRFLLVGSGPSVLVGHRLALQSRVSMVASCTVKPKLGSPRSVRCRDAANRSVDCKPRCPCLGRLFSARFVPHRPHYGSCGGDRRVCEPHDFPNTKATARVQRQPEKPHLAWAGCGLLCCGVGHRPRLPRQSGPIPSERESSSVSCRPQT